LAIEFKCLILYYSGIPLFLEILTDLSWKKIGRRPWENGPGFPDAQGESQEGRMLPIKKVEELIKVSKMYQKGDPHKFIAHEIGKSVPYISALIKEAKSEGILQETVEVIPPYDQTAAEEIKRKFRHLNKVTVVRYRNEDLLSELGKYGAQDVKEFLQTKDSVAISCGTSIRALLRELKKRPGVVKGIEVLPLLVTMNSRYEQPSSGGLVSEMAEIFPDSVGEVIQFPRAKPGKGWTLKKIKDLYESQCEEIFRRALKARCMIIGIGAILYQEVSRSQSTFSFNYMVRELELIEVLKKAGGVGECLNQPLSIEGEILIDEKGLEPLRNNLIYVPLRELQRLVREGKTILAIAGGKDKHAAILAALRGKIFDRLVTDMETAEYLLGA
jgi:deoxyribonucleoside regulator